jgi:hypothetical protein
MVFLPVAGKAIEIAVEFSRCDVRLHLFLGRLRLC